MSALVASTDEALQAVATPEAPAGDALQAAADALGRPQPADYVVAIGPTEWERLKRRVKEKDERPAVAAKAILKEKARARRLAADVLQSPGLGECLHLCDASEIERICEVVREEFRLLQQGHAASMHLSLRRQLIEPLERYRDSILVADRTYELPALPLTASFIESLESLDGIPVIRRTSSGQQRMELEPTHELLSIAERVGEALEDGRGDLGEHLCSTLERAWFRWMAYVATHWLQFIAVEKMSEVQARREQGSEGGKRSKPKGQMTDLARKIVAEYRRLLQTHERKDVAALLEARGDCSAAYARRVWNAYGDPQPVADKKGEPEAGV